MPIRENTITCSLIMISQTWSIRSIYMNLCLFCSLKSGKVLSVSFTKVLAKAECVHNNLFFFFFHRETRLGRNGIADIKKHKFFVTDLWDWNTIRNSKLSLRFFLILLFSLLCRLLNCSFSIDSPKALLNYFKVFWNGGLYYKNKPTCNSFEYLMMLWQ